MRKSFWLMSAGAFALATPAFAQPTTTAEPSATEEAASLDPAVQAEAGETDARDEGEIIVTATRRSEALSDIPLAVSAVSGDTLENSGATDIRQLQQLSPSLQVSSTQSEGGASTARIRGVGTVGDNPGLESSVAVFVDGVYRSRNATALTELGPIERIEVLRGPQGTLFGRNASAGLISIITARPSFETEISGQASYGNYDFFRGELGVTGPLGEGLAGRIDGIYQRRDGFITDAISGRDVNNRDRYLIRGQLLFEPTDALSVRIIGDYAERDEECCAAVYLTPFDTVRGANGSITQQPSTVLPLLQALGAVIPTDPYERIASITPGRNYRQDVRDWGLSGELVYDFGAAELTSITAYRSNRFIRGGDFDYNNLDIVFRDDDGGARTDFSAFTQEFRLQGEAFEGRLDWLVGGYFANEDITNSDNLGYGADYQKYASCLVASSISQQLSAAFGSSINLVSPAASGCFNKAVGGAIASNPLVPAATRQLVGLLSGNGPGPLNNLQGFQALAAALGVPTATLNLQTPQDIYEQNSRNFAVFTHNVFEVTPDLHFTMGLRYTNERKRLEADLTDTNILCGAIAASPFAALGQLPCVLPNVPGGNLTGTDERAESALSGTAVISYRPIPELLTYASYSRGYKSGGYNFDRTALPRQIIAGSTGPFAGPVLGTATLNDLEFGSEQVDAFEVGVKYNGRGFDLNIAAFHQTFDDFQLNTFNGINFIVENVNSCSETLGGEDTDNDPTTGACTGDLNGGVVSRGIEVEAFMRPAQDIGVNLGATLVDTRYRDNLVGSDGRALTNVLFQLPGERLSNSSMWTLTGSFTWTPPIGDTGLTGLVYFDGRYQTEFNTGSDLDIEKIQPAYFVANARLGIRGADDRWGIELWAQNLFNQDYMQIAFDAFIQGSCTAQGAANNFCTPPNTGRSTQLYGAFLAEPRTFGVTGRFRF